MVFAPSSLLPVAALVAAFAQYAHATSIELNAYTPLEVVIPIDKDCPMRGSRPSPQMVQPVVDNEDPTLSRAEVNAAVSVDISVNGGDASWNATAPPEKQVPQRKLEVTSNDVVRLEQFFGTSMETNVNTLFQKYPRAEFKPAPWPSSYWPTYRDSINDQWGNDVSASDKYAKAFGLNVKQFKDKVSANLGIDSQADPTRACTSDSQCSRFKDGSACAKRDGKTSGYCVPTWFGICHAWAPASILEDEPRCDVQKNGVTFHPFDIKALMTAIYDGANTPVVFTGARYNGAGSTRDEYGRYTDAAERDLGPGFFHIAVTNIMGRFGKSFVVDVNADAQVWNQPVRSYSLTQPKIMTPSAAAKQYFNVAAYPFNQGAKSVAYVEMQFKYINEYIQDGPLVSTGVVDSATATRNYKYLLELDAKQNIIGGEWVGSSQTDHPDFLWFPTGKPDANAVTDVGLSYKDVSALLKQSVACGTPTPTTPTPTPTTTAPVTTTPVTTTPVTTTPATTSPTPTTTAPVTTAPTPSTKCGNDQTGPKKCPAGQYCNQWNPDAYECRRIDAKCGKQNVGIDFWGADIKTVVANMPEECCAKCQANKKCRAYTFVQYYDNGIGYCYLKSQAGWWAMRNSDAISASIVRS